MALSDIGVVVQGPAASGNDDLTGNAQAVLREVRGLLQRLLESGETGAIDLRAMPLSDADLRWLARQLGEGEIRVTLDAGGRSTITETQAPGVWWVTHRNEQDKVVSEFMEITWVPDLVATQREDAILGLAYLDKLMVDLSQS
jgi:hydrogenase-1 operon protein HyaF